MKPSFILNNFHIIGRTTFFGLVFVVSILLMTGVIKNKPKSVPYYSQIVIGLTDEVYNEHINDLSVYGNTLLSSYRRMGVQNPTIEFPIILGYQSYVVTGSMDIKGQPMTYRCYNIYPPNQRPINLTLMVEKEGFEKVNNEIVHIINTMNFGEPAPADFESEVYVDNLSNLQFRYPKGWTATRDDKYINVKRETPVKFIQTTSYNSNPNSNTNTTTVTDEPPVPVFQYTVTNQDEWALQPDSVQEKRLHDSDKLQGD